jgi:hypothetical protein
MTVALTVSETINGAAVADTLEGGGVGSDLGTVTNSGYAPRINKVDNTGRLDLFIRHDSANPITDFQSFIQQYGTDTGYAYGGGQTPVDDFTNIRNLGAASGGSRNNLDGLSGGLWIDMNANVAEVNQFDYFTNGLSSTGSQGGDDTVRIYGDNNLDGIDVESGFEVAAKAMVTASDQGNGGGAGNGFIPNTPTAGTLGIIGDTDLGDNAHVKLRMYLTQTFSQGGLHQWEWVGAYSFTT